MTQTTPPSALTPCAHPTLARTALPIPGLSALPRDLLLIGGGAALVALLSQIELPLHPVPLTLQTLGVLLVGAALGWRRGVAALGLYVAAGAAGLPIFSGGGAGLAKLTGPTGGYLLGFVVAAALVGYLAERYALDRSLPGTALAMLLGTAVIYALGLGGLHLSLGLSGSALLTAGLTPFLLGDALKLGLAALLLPAAWAWVGRR